jgi:hypothetical protein
LAAVRGADIHGAVAGEGEDVGAGVGVEAADRGDLARGGEPAVPHAAADEAGAIGEGDDRLAAVHALGEGDEVGAAVGVEVGEHGGFALGGEVLVPFGLGGEAGAGREHDVDVAGAVGGEEDGVGPAVAVDVGDAADVVAVGGAEGADDHAAVEVVAAREGDVDLGFGEGPDVVAAVAVEVTDGRDVAAVGPPALPQLAGAEAAAVGEGDVDVERAGAGVPVGEGDEVVAAVAVDVADGGGLVDDAAQPAVQALGADAGVDAGLVGAGAAVAPADDAGLLPAGGGPGEQRAAAVALAGVLSAGGVAGGDVDGGVEAGAVDAGLGGVAVG